MWNAKNVDVPRGTICLTGETGLIKIILLLIQACLLITLVGCKSEDKEPHLRDPIYNDLKREADAYTAAAQAEEAKIQKLEEDYNKAEVRTIDRKTIANDLYKAKESHKKALQMAEYYKIKVKLREAEARIQYKKAFLAGKDWPDPQEFESYKLHKQLQHNSRNWSDRLPKKNQAIEAEITSATSH